MSDVISMLHAAVVRFRDENYFRPDELRMRKATLKRIAADCGLEVKGTDGATIFGLPVVIDKTLRRGVVVPALAESRQIRHVSFTSSILGNEIAVDVRQSVLELNRPPRA